MTHHTRLNPDYMPGPIKAGGSAATIKASWGSPDQPVGDLPLSAQVGLDALTQLLKSPDASDIIAAAAAKHIAALLDVASCLVAEEVRPNLSGTERAVVRATRISATALMELHVVLGSVFGELATYSGPSSMALTFTTIMRSTLEQAFPTNHKLLQRTPVQVAFDGGAPPGEGADALGIAEHYGLWRALVREDASSAEALAGYARRATLLMVVMSLCKNEMLAPSDLVSLSQVCSPSIENREQLAAIWRLAGNNPKEQGK